jgi:basic membrane protein A and related proteins
MRTPVNKRLLALIAAGAVVLGACSNSGATTAPSAAASGAPSAAAPSAAATAAGSPIPTAPPASLAISPAASAAASQTGLKATYISTGPIGDNPFLQLIANGLTQAGKDCGVQTSIVESKDTTVMSDNFRAAIDDKTDLIVANSFDSVDAITKLGKQFPDQKWAVVDTTVDNPNVRGLVFQEHEGTYLIGAIFGLLATGNYAPYPKSDVIGAVGAIDQPFIRRWLVGFQEGVKAVNPNAKLIDGFGNSFNDPATSKELALAQFNQGAKYIFSFAAAGNTGIFEAAKEKNFYTSGVDTDQRPIDPAHILESMVKRTDLGVYDSVCDLAKGQFKGGIAAYGLKQRGVGPAFIALDNINPPSALPPEVQDKVKALAADIASGKIVVTDYLAQPQPSASAQPSAEPSPSASY